MNLMKSLVLGVVTAALVLAAAGVAEANGRTAVVVKNGNVAVARNNNLAFRHNHVGFNNYAFRNNYGFNNYAFRNNYGFNNYATYAYPVVPTVAVSVPYSQVAVSPAAFQSYAPAAYEAPPVPVAAPVCAAQVQYQAPVAPAAYGAPVCGAQVAYGSYGAGYGGYGVGYGYGGYRGFGFGHGHHNGFGGRTIIVRR